jgi:hypothetical protein
MLGTWRQGATHTKRSLRSVGGMGKELHTQSEMCVGTCQLHVSDTRLAKT